MEDIDYDDVARVSVDMAKYVDKIRPDVMTFPLRSGWTAGKFMMEALRNNLCISAAEYDPPIFPVALNFIDEPYTVAKGQLARLEQLRNKKEVRENYPEFEKLMIIDSTNWCVSPTRYLLRTIDEITKFGEKVYVNFMAGSDRENQERVLRYYGLLQDDRLEFHFSRLKSMGIPFDNDDRLLGIKSDKNFNYVPFGFPLKRRERLPSEPFDIIVESAQELYKNVKKALDRRKGLDKHYRLSRQKSKEFIASYPTISK